MLWGNRVVLPIQGRRRALDMLHETHPSMRHMKVLARGYLWWPGMDADIERCVKSCSACQVSRSMPPAAPPHPWVKPERPWSRVHIYYAGLFLGQMFLLLVDAPLKWLEIHATRTSTSAKNICECRSAGNDCLRQCDKFHQRRVCGLSELKRRSSCEVSAVPSCLQWPCREGSSDIQGGHETAQARFIEHSTVTIPATVSYLFHRHVSFRVNVG